MARTLPNTIQDGDDFTATPVQENFDNLNNRFGTGSTGISNSDIYTIANIATTKSQHGGAILLSAFLNSEHDAATGAHTFADNGCEGLYITPNASNPQFATIVTAQSLTLENSAGIKKRITDVSETVNLTTGQAPNGTLLATAEAISTGYHIVILYDSAATTATAVYYTGLSTTDPADVLDTTFWETDLPAFNTAVGGGAAYDYAKCVGWQYNDANGDFEVPRPIAGGSVGDAYMPSFVLMSTGTYTGSGSGQTITGVGFLADSVEVYHQAQTYGPVIKTNTISGTTSITYDYDFYNTHLATAAITNIAFDEFTVGNSQGTDKVGDTYHWRAFKNHSPSTLTPGG